MDRPEPRVEVPKEAPDEQIIPPAEVEQRFTRATQDERIMHRRNEILARARLITEGFGAMEDMPPEIALLARREVNTQVNRLVEQVMENVLEADESGTLKRALEESARVLGGKKEELSPTEQLKTTLMTRLEFLARQKEKGLQDPRQAEEFNTGMEKAARGALERMAELRRQKRPPGSAGSPRSEASA